MASSKRLSRRTFLRGAGVAIALPMLDAMAARGKDEPTRRPVRFVTVYSPCGMNMADWTPTSAGADFEFTPILKPLEPHRASTLVLSNLNNNTANANGDAGGDHARASASFLTAVQARKTNVWADVRTGISADQLAALALGGRTRIGSLQLGLDENLLDGPGDTGYHPAYLRAISWTPTSMPLLPQNNPRRVFDALFSSYVVRPRAATDPVGPGSILDPPEQEGRRLLTTLGAEDRHVVDAYLTEIREVEARIQRLERDNLLREPITEDAPQGPAIPFAAHADLMFDLQVLALRGDVTRISTFMLGREASRRRYPELGINVWHHTLSDHQGSPANLANLTLIDTHHTAAVARFVSKLAATREGPASLLDNCMIVYGSGIADGNRHSHNHLPIVLIGNGGGTIRSGRRVEFANDTPLANLWLAILDRMGLQPGRFGDSTGVLEI